MSEEKTYTKTEIRQAMSNIMVILETVEASQKVKDVVTLDHKTLIGQLNQIK